MSKKTQQEVILEAINKTTSEIQDLLRKSLPEFEKAMDDDQELPDPTENKTNDAVAGEGSEDAGPQGEAGEEAGEAGEAQGAEGADQMGEDGGAESDALEQHLQSMPDDELQMLIEAAMAENQKRQANQQPPEGQTPPPPAATEPAEKAMKEDYLKLTKSLETITNAIESLAKDVAGLKSLKKSVTSAPLATNSQTVSGKRTSEKPVQRLSKSETIDVLMSKVGKDKNVNSDLIATVNACRDEETLANIQDTLKNKGIL